MKKPMIILGIIFGLIVYQASTAEVFLTTPEQGITCMRVQSLFGGIAPVGCYRGDIHKEGNCLDLKATEEYQNGNRVMYLDKDTCIPH